MFDLIIAYLVIMFLVNTAKSAKEQQKKGTAQQKNTSSGKQKGKYAPYGNKRLPQKKQSEPLPKQQPVSRPAKAAGSTVVCADDGQRKTSAQSVASQGSTQTRPVKQPKPIMPTVAVSAEEERLQEILEPSEENILTGLVWSEILGPPVAKRSRRY